jgi:hypothetical protein
MIVQRSILIMRRKGFGLSYTLSQIVEFIAGYSSMYSIHLSVIFVNGAIY